jgi:multicomponent K+:H+ antiporter subunit A
VAARPTARRLPVAVTVLLIVLLPLVAGLPMVLLAKRRGPSSAWAAAGATAASLTLVATSLRRVFGGEDQTFFLPWAPELGLNLALRLDGLALLFAVLILVIGLLVILYARYYLEENESFGRLYGLLMLFMTAMLGVVTADNLLVLFVFWELTSVASFLLIAFWQDEPEARRGARVALAVTVGGGLAMLAGFLILGSIAGSYEIPVLIAEAARIRTSPLYPVALVLVLIGAFTKSAQFPFHFWLPEAMAAPTPVSAYLHSATMVKAGVFLLARLYPVLGGTALFEYVVCSVGLVTFVLGAYLAVFQHDLKGLLAYSTISHLGLITFLLGLDSPLSLLAALFHIVNHATFKASLFMAAGIIDHEFHTRDMRRLNGLWTLIPYTATLAIVATAAMAGVPLLNGFLSKEMFFAEALDLHQLRVLGTVAPVAVTLGGIFAVAYSTRFIHDVFFDAPPIHVPETAHELPRFIKIPVEILVFACVVVGVLPNRALGGIVDVAASSALRGELPEHSFALWHGFNAPLAMSVIAFVGGFLMYWLLHRHYQLQLHVRTEWTGVRMLEGGLRALLGMAHRIRATLFEPGRLQRSIVALVGVALGLGLVALTSGGSSVGQVPLTPVPPVIVGDWVLAVLAAIGCVVWHRTRGLAVVLSGAAGLAVSLLFLHLSAPDLALTQLSVEVVATVLLLMALTLLPPKSPRESSPRRRLRDGALAGLAGLGVAVVAFTLLTREHATISWYFVENSLPRTGGANMVNVILVEFRAFDTWAEITVLALAALGVHAVLEGVRLGPADSGGVGSIGGSDRVPPSLGVAARWLLPFALTVSAYLFLRGHNAPGGGFVAGLISAGGLVLQQVAHGHTWAAARARLDHVRVIGWGLLVAASTGLGAWAFGRPFLSSAYGKPVLPWLGELPLSSALLFDLGVYLTVVGATLLMIGRLAEAAEPQPAVALDGER